ncbi:PH domain-containing protein [Weissella minor]|uniref:SHOCT domain-containing protein n=1 Tax=Weissella minor TaxID=1620 RepID=A0A0R2JK48_9LACO|nr:PH domain-containing protein [Weissella minor]KRN77618.1 hypothetical protein IV67_GL001462 [Weissella minor]
MLNLSILLLIIFTCTLLIIFSINSGTKSESKVKTEQIKTEILYPETTSKKSKRINTQLCNLPGFDSFGTKKELSLLPDILNDTENIIYVVSGNAKNDGLFGISSILLVLTDQRLIMFDAGLLYGSEYTEIPFDHIQGVSLSSGLVLADIHIENGRRQINIINVTKPFAAYFVDQLNKKINEINFSKNNQNTISSPADELQKLANLYEDGILTKQEFSDQKKELLGK